MAKESTVFIGKDVNRDAVLQFIKMSKENKTDIHSFEIIQNGEVKVKFAPAPYSFEYKQQLYSMSKSFTSTAIGILSDGGKLNIEDKLTDIFPEYCPENIGENAAKIRIKHLLSMNTGHAQCVLGDVRSAKEPVRAFLSIEPEFEPGTHFCYNNAATYMLSKIVSKVSGMTVFDFLSARLFAPLGIEGVYWDAFDDGCSQGAVGLHASTEDIAKLGVLYLGGGVYDGKRLLSEEWVKTASAKHSDNSDNGSPDWTAGYGFQFWRNSRGGYRGDGAFGQFCLILPEKNTVFAMEALVCDMQKELDTAFELLEVLYGGSKAGTDEIKKLADEYNTPAKYSAAACGAFSERTYICDKNRFGITQMKFCDKADKIELIFSDGEMWQTMSFGKDKFCENRVTVRKMKPTLEGLAGHERKEDMHFAAYCTWQGDGLHLYMNYLDNPHTDDYVCTFGGEKCTMKRAENADFAYNETIFFK